MNAVSDIFKKMEGTRVLVVGDVMVDRYLSGQVHRISPEAPVPVVEMENMENRLGGAANVALNLRAMDAEPVLCSVIGSDEAAIIFQELLPEQALSARGILRSKERKTTIKTRVMAGNQQLLRVDSEDISDLTTADADRFLKHFKKILNQEQFDVVVLQDYNKGVLSQRVIHEILLETFKRNIPVTVDPKKQNIWAYKRTRLFKPNLKEVRDSVPFEVEPTLEHLNQAAGYIRSKLNNEQTLITLSAKGIYYDDGVSAAILPTFPRSIADVSGAGDTVISIVALGIAAGLDLKTIATLANLAGGQVCEKVGVVPVARQQLITEASSLIPALSV